MSDQVFVEKIGVASFDNTYGPDQSKKDKVKKESIYLEEDDDEAIFEVSKAVDKNLVSGWASVAVQADGTIPLDWQGDIIATESLEKAAIKFMEDYRASGEQHEGDEVGTIVESIVFTKQKMEAMGIAPGILPEGWFVTVKIEDSEVFAKVKSGQYKMFSIQGKAKRLKV